MIPTILRLSRHVSVLGNRQIRLYQPDAQARVKTPDGIPRLRVGLVFLFLPFALLLLIMLVGCSTSRDNRFAANRPVSEAIQLKNEKGPVTMQVRVI